MSINSAAPRTRTSSASNSVRARRRRRSRFPLVLHERQPNVGPGGTPGSSWILGPIGFGTLNPANIATRTSLVNVHIGIPHKNDALRDDIQLLYDNDEIFTTFLSSVNDEGLNNWLGTVGTFPPYYLDTFQYKGPLGALLPANYALARNAVRLPVVARTLALRRHTRPV